MRILIRFFTLLIFSGMILTSSKSNIQGNDLQNNIKSSKAASSSNIQSYYSIDDFPDNMEFASNSSMKLIDKYYDKINFKGNFEKGDMKNYDFYRKKYAQLITNNEVIIYTDKTEQYFNNIYTLYDLDDGLTKLYLFDMDEDKVPELCIAGLFGTYVIKYNNKDEQYYIWWSLQHSGGDILGSKKIAFTYEGSDSYFYQLDEFGNIEYSTVFIRLGEKSNSNYLLGLPQYKGETNSQLLEAIKQPIYCNKSNDTYYLKVTSKQIKNILERYEDAQIFAVNNRVSLSYLLSD